MTAFLIDAGDALIVAVLGSVAEAILRLSDGSGGCNCVSAWNDNESGVSKLSFEHNRRTAPVTSPSSSLADALLAIDCSTDLICLNLELLILDFLYGIHLSSLNERDWFLMDVVKFLFKPPLSGL